MKLIKKLRSLALCCLCLNIGAVSIVQAAPDELENFLNRRQNQRSQNDNDELGRLVQSKTSSREVSRGEAGELLSNAMGLIGVAYRFGGTSPATGMDCSGFMQYIFRKTFAITLPRTAAEQATVGTYVARHDLQPGDMVFFRTAGSRISHVGMYVGNDRFIHAPRTGKRIEITSLSNKYWSSKYATARRVKRHGADQFIR